MQASVQVQHNTLLFRGQARIEEWLNSASHGIGALLSLAGMAVLIVLASLALDPWKIVSVSIYGISLTTLYLVSTLYHASRRTHVRNLLQVLDHCAIFLLIAGTYTPFVLVNMRGPIGFTIFGLTWGLATIGIVTKLLWPKRFHALRVCVYVLMGWLMCMFPGEMVSRLSTTGLWLLVAGGATYTLGIIFYAIDRLPYNHAIWHLFVIGGSVCHFLAICFAVLPYAPGATG